MILPWRVGKCVTPGSMRNLIVVILCNNTTGILQWCYILNMKIHQEVLENTKSLKPRGCTGPDGIRITWRCPYLKCEHKPTVLHATLGVTAGEFEIPSFICTNALKQHPQQPTHFCHCNLPSNWIREFFRFLFQAPAQADQNSPWPLGPGTLPASPVGMSPAPPV